MSELLFVYGPPGSGKSSVGRLLAQSLSLSFCDLDQEIETAAGQTIAHIFEIEGESGFRACERARLNQLLASQQNGIIALGGGALADDSTRLLVESHGPVLLLTASPEVLQRRIQIEAGPIRPLLLGDTTNQLARLLALRSRHYASFPLRLDTSALTLEQAVCNAQALLGMFGIDGMGRPYQVRMLPGGLDRIGSLMASRSLCGPVVLVSDETVGELYGSRVASALASAGYPTRMVLIPPGESQKNYSTILQLWETFLAAGVERGSTVVALGGGVVSDLTGFAAATWMRGIPWVCLPTTLVSMADASLGGKTGIDLAQGKNLVGAFHPPIFVLADPDTLATLPEGELRSGMAEVVKHGLIGDPKLFQMVAAGGELQMTEIVRRSMAVKIAIIQADPFEDGQRAALNLGHTVGHAIEKASGYRMRHGEAVAAGLVIETRLAESIGLADHGLAETIAATLEKRGLPTKLPVGLDHEALLDALNHDKKRRGGKIHFALPVRVGEVKTGVVIENLEEALWKQF